MPFLIRAALKSTFFCLLLKSIFLLCLLNSSFVVINAKLTMKIYTDASQLALTVSLSKLSVLEMHVGRHACNT